MQYFIYVFEIDMKQKIIKGQCLQCDSDYIKIYAWLLVDLSQHLWFILWFKIQLLLIMQYLLGISDIKASWSVLGPDTLDAAI